MGRLKIVYFLICFSSFISVSNAAFAAMSIDLGNQFIKIGLVKPGVPMEIVLNKDSRRKTPFVVGIKNGERFFGDAAIQLGMKHPANTLHSFLDLIGKSIDHPIVENYIKQNPHLTLLADVNRGTVVVKLDNVDYSIETLLAMILWNVRIQCEAHARQSIKDVVITVPVFFNQVERKLIAVAAEIADLNLLQLLTDGSGAGLNYGVFRRKLITEQPQTLLIYDVGHSKTTATIVEFRLVKEKNSKEQNPVITTLGIGYDRTLGGSELTYRLRQHLLQQFVKNNKPTGEITQNPRAMAKLQKEAERVKQVLSANTDHFAQIESLFENKDFRLKVQREEFQNLFAEIEPRFIKPVDDALRMAEMKADQIDLIVLMGAGTRVPRLQQVLQESFKNKELGRFLNTDEAIAMGLVYQAAHLSKGFKVKQFDVQELQIHPVQVSFISGALSEEGPHYINRVLYGYKSMYPASKKVISFTSHTDDFKLNLNYGPLNHLNVEQLLYFGQKNITVITIKGLTDVLKTEIIDETTVFKGVKVHFKMDLIGAVEAIRAEAIIERPEKDLNSTFSAIVDKIGGLFSDSSKSETEKNKKDQNNSGEKKSTDGANSYSDSELPPSNSTENNSQSNSQNEKSSKNSENKKDENFLDKKKDETNKTEEQDFKPKVIKFQLTLEFEQIFQMLSADEIKNSANILTEFEKKEKTREEKDTALNSLEAAIYDLSANVEDDSFTKFASNEELEILRTLLNTLKIWLEDDVDFKTTTEEFVAKKIELDASAKKIRFRKRQNEERGKFVEVLQKSLSASIILSFKELPSFFTETELNDLDKLLADTTKWLNEKQKKQEELAYNVDPVLIVSELKEKANAVDREVKYLTKKFFTAKLKIEQDKIEKAKEEAAAKLKKAENNSKNKNSESELDPKSAETEKITPSNFDEEKMTEAEPLPAREEGEL